MERFYLCFDNCKLRYSSAVIALRDLLKSKRLEEAKIIDQNGEIVISYGRSPTLNEEKETLLT